MSSNLGPYWADTIAAAVKTGDETTRAEALGCKPRKRFRINSARLLDSAAKGGRIGGRVRGEKYAKRRGE